MPSHKQTKISPYSAKQIYDLVADIEQYPLFIPWLSHASILSAKGQYLEARLDIQFKAIRTHYVSKVELMEGDNDSPYIVDVGLLKGPFKKMVNHWEITPLEDGSCEIGFFVEFVFNSLLLDKAMGVVFNRAVQEMTGCFERRAELLYGKPG